MVQGVQPLSQTVNGEARERDVRGLLLVVSEFGSAAEKFFDRLYHALNRKQTQQNKRPDYDQLAQLRQANRELSVRIRLAETIALRLQAVFASIGEGVIMQDTEGRLVLMNDAARALLGSVRTFWDTEI